MISHFLFMNRLSHPSYRQSSPFQWGEWINVPLLLLWLVGFGIFFGGMPKYNDDYWYMAGLKPWFEAQGITNPDDGGNIFTNGIPFDAIRDIWQYHYQQDNIRLPNVIVPFFLLLPKWVGGTLVTFLLGWITVLAIRIAGYDWRKSPVTPLVIFVTTFFFPWRDNFGVQVFQFNYIISTWICLCLFHWLRKVRSGPIAWTVALLFGFVAGWSHEGIALPTACGLFALFICYRKWRRWEVALAIVGIATALCFLAHTPHTTGHIQFTINSLLKDFGVYLLYILPIGVPIYFIMLVSILAIVIYGQGHRLFRNYKIVFCLASATASILITALTQSFSRVTIWATLVSMIALLIMLRMTTKRRFQTYSTSTASGAFIIMTIVYVHLTFIDIYALQFRHYKHEFLDPYPERWNTGYFAELKDITQIPAPCLNLPDPRFVETATMYTHFYHPEVSLNAKPTEYEPAIKHPIVSAELEYVDSLSGHPAGEDRRFVSLTASTLSP